MVNEWIFVYFTLCVDTTKTVRNIHFEGKCPYQVSLTNAKILLEAKRPCHYMKNFLECSTLCIDRELNYVNMKTFFSWSSDKLTESKHCLTGLYGISPGHLQLIDARLLKIRGHQSLSRFIMSAVYISLSNCGSGEHKIVGFKFEQNNKIISKGIFDPHRLLQGDI